MRRAAPLHSLVAVVGGWLLVRVVVETVIGTAISSPTQADPVASRVPQSGVHRASLATVAAPQPLVPPYRRPTHPARRHANRDGGRLSSLPLMLATYVASERPTEDAPHALAPAPPAGGAADGPLLSLEPAGIAASRSRWSGSAWLLARGGEIRSIARGGEIGGSQAGARVAYRLDDAGRLALFGRGYAPLRRSGAEVSAGIEWRPDPAAPVRLMVERRQRVGGGGRSAWMASVVGGIYAEPLPGVLRIDGYGQAGIVGVHSHDRFADGSARAGYPAALGGGATMTVGAGIWGAAQPGAKRLDAGPQMALRVPVARTTLLVAADYRLRIAGGAAPRSGPALTVGIDF